MSTSVIRIYPTGKQAAEALRMLRDEGFEEEALLMFSPPAAALVGGPSVSDEILSSALMAGDLLKADAALCAQALRDGHTVVIVRAPFGSAETAEGLLDSCGPIDIGLGAGAWRPSWNDGAPLSSAIGIPAVIDNAAPLSNFLSLPLLSRQEDQGPAFGIRQLTRPGWSLSSKLGMGMLSRNATPLSSMFGLGLLSGKAAPLSSALGLRTTVSRPSPLSSLLGWGTLAGRRPEASSDAAPLSRALGLPLLSQRPSRSKVPLPALTSPRFSLFGRGLSDKAAPLSSMVGVGLLSRKAAPLSSMLGLGLLSRKAAPLSSIFGLPTVVNCPAPLSALFSMPVLSRI